MVTPSGTVNGCVVLQSAFNVHAVPFFANEHVVSIGTSNPFNDSEAVLRTFGGAFGGGTVVVDVRVVVVDVGRLAVVVVVDVDARAANAGRPFTNIASSSTSPAVSAETLRRLMRFIAP
jgi:hypothetical protein